MSEIEESKTPEPELQWAWWDAKEGCFAHIYPSRLAVIMCFGDESVVKRKIAAGKGRLLQVQITPVEDEE